MINYIVWVNIQIFSDDSCVTIQNPRFKELHVDKMFIVKQVFVQMETFL